MSAPQMVNGNRRNPLSATGPAILASMGSRLQASCRQVRDIERTWGAPRRAVAADMESALEELRATEEQLAEALADREAERARYFDLFELAPDSLIVTDLHGSILEVNRAAVTMLNVSDRSAQYLLKKPLMVFVDAPDHALFYSAIARLRGAGTGTWTLRLRPREKRAVIITDVIAKLIHDPRSAKPTIRWAIRDSTEQHRARHELSLNQCRLRELTAELSLAEERERRRIATGIHDRITQSLAVAKMLLGELRKHANETQQQRLNDLRSLLEQAIDESRTLTFELSPPMLYQLGLGPAVAWLAEEVRRRQGIDIVVTDRVATPEAIPVDLRVLMFQAVRELLTNAVKHARSKRVDIVMEIDQPNNALRVAVSDKGSGFVVARALTPQRGGFGLFNLQTRFEQLGATF